MLTVPDWLSDGWIYAPYYVTRGLQSAPTYYLLDWMLLATLDNPPCVERSDPIFAQVGVEGNQKCLSPHMPHGERGSNAQ